MNSDMTSLEAQNGSKHYRVRKELVWLITAMALMYAIHSAWDWWTYLEWPPHPRTHPEKIEALNCPKDGRYIVTQSQLPEVSKTTMNAGGVNRKMFFEFPECAAGLYLAYEGSGTRQTAYVYDVEKKRRTATIVSTFDKYEE